MDIFYLKKKFPLNNQLFFKDLIYNLKKNKI